MRASLTYQKDERKRPTETAKTRDIYGTVLYVGLFALLRHANDQSLERAIHHIA